MGVSAGTTDWFRVRTGTAADNIEQIVDEWSEANGAFDGWFTDLSSLDGQLNGYVRFSLDADADPNVGEGVNIDELQVGCLDAGRARSTRR